MEDSGAEKRNDRLLQTPQGFSNSKAALEDALARIERTLAGGPLDSAQRASLHFAAANLLDRLSCYDQAFAHARLAHQERNVQYDPRIIERLVDEKIELFTPTTLRCAARASEGSDKPVFIVGMPQSGISMVEQVLAAHPMVHGAGELHWIGQIEHAVLQRTPAATRRKTLDLRRCSLEFVNEMATQYLRPLIALHPQATRIIDTMPLNFLNLGLIAVLFPDARVIHCMRDPMDTCVSCYLAELPVGNEFSADLATLAHFFRQYRRLMDHWKKVLDYSILEVTCEAMGKDPESRARDMLEFLGLPWNAQCVSFPEMPPVASDSDAQIRGHIWLERWKNYANHLEPIRSGLQELLGHAGAP